MIALFASLIYVSLIFVACFTCSSELFCYVFDKVSFSDNAGFHAIEGYWEGVTVNHSSVQEKKNEKSQNANYSMLQESLFV
jgi:hypothetical protein